MESMARSIVAQYGLSGSILATSVKDLWDSDAKTRSRAGSGPSIGWTIGHLGGIGAIRKDLGRKAISELVRGQ
jgi:hypothetical protein